MGNTLKAVVIDSFGPAENMHVREIPVPLDNRMLIKFLRQASIRWTHTGSPGPVSALFSGLYRHSAAKNKLSCYSEGGSDDK
jgi:hypothetical protein